jgi:hypothetical protein
MRRVRVFLSILIVFLLFSFFSCLDENCVTVGVTNSTSESIRVSPTACWLLAVNIPAGKSSNIIVELGEVVNANGYQHVFTREYEIWEIK